MLQYSLQVKKNELLFRSGWGGNGLISVVLNLNGNSLKVEIISFTYLKHFPLQHLNKMNMLP